MLPTPKADALAKEMRGERLKARWACLTRNWTGSEANEPPPLISRILTPKADSTGRHIQTEAGVEGLVGTKLCHGPVGSMNRGRDIRGRIRGSSLPIRGSSLPILVDSDVPCAGDWARHRCLAWATHRMIAGVI
jgi:hypothetical protein